MQRMRYKAVTEVQTTNQIVRLYSLNTGVFMKESVYEVVSTEQWARYDGKYE